MGETKNIKVDKREKYMTIYEMDELREVQTVKKKITLQVHGWVIGLNRAN